jgi:hypothetical protein
MVVSLIAPGLAVAQAAPDPAQVVRSDGDQSRGRWQVFDLDPTDQRPITVHATWDGDADVNLFLLDDGDTIAWANSPTARPETLVHDAARRPDQLAVLVKTGSATYVAEVHHGPAPAGPQLDPTPNDGPEPAHEFSSRGDQASGRWQVFDLDPTDERPITVHATWDGDADVNLFLLDDGDTIAWANSPTARPETLVHDAARRPDQLAVLVKTGSATYVAEVFYGSAPGSGATPPPAAPDPEPGPAPPQGSPGGAYPGRPAPGTLYWGAAVGGNTDPTARHETPAGTPLGVRRTFFQWRQRTTSLLAIARDDIATGRLPWVSIKPPSWGAMARGDHDREIDQLLTGLDALDGPVWLTIHHEPEGGGGINRPDDPAGPSGHVAMNRRVRQRLDALGVDNVALAPILMSWTYDPRSGRNPDDWWAPGIYDLLGIDHYRSTTTLLDNRWAIVRRWADLRSVDVAVGEWGTRGSDDDAADRMRAWHQAGVDSAAEGRGARVVALSAFDSGLNAPGGPWTLTGAQLATFHQLLRHPASAHPRRPPSTLPGHLTTSRWTPDTVLIGQSDRHSSTVLNWGM